MDPFRFRSGIAALTVITAVPLAGLAGLGPATTASAEETGAPKLLSGVLKGEGGGPVAKAEITVFVEKQMPGGDLATPIARGVTTSDGKFLIRGALGTTPVSYYDDGAVQLEVVVTTDQDEKYFNLIALPPAQGRPDWTWAKASDPGLLPEGTGDSAGQVLAGISLNMATSETAAAEDADAISPHDDSLVDKGEDPTSEDLADTQGEIEAVAEDANASAAFSAASAGTGDQCSYRYWKNMDVYRKRHVQSQRIHVMNRTRQHYAWETSSESELQLLYSFEGKYKGKVPVGGGLSRSSVNTNTAGVSFTKKDPWSGSVALLFRYRKQREMCKPTMSGTGMEDYYDTGKRRWKSRNFTGGYKGNPIEKVWGCNTDYRYKIAGPLTIKYGTSVFWNGWFEILGVKLDHRQGSSENTELTIRPKGSLDWAWVCGYKDDPAVASRVREVRTP